jgi:hypothetical protein
MTMKALKIVLVAIGLVCALGCAPGVVAPWPTVNHWLGIIGVEPLPDQPMVVYCVRLSSLGFALIGVFFLLLATDPLRYRPLLALGVWGLLLTSAVALTTGRLVAMQPPWYWADSGVSLLVAVLILVFWPRQSKAPSRE